MILKHLKYSEIYQKSKKLKTPKLKIFVLKFSSNRKVFRL